jgi:hypothetical protein
LTISDESWDEVDSFLEDAEKAEKRLPPIYHDTPSCRTVPS